EARRRLHVRGRRSVWLGAAGATGAARGPPRHLSRLDDGGVAGFARGDRCRGSALVVGPNALARRPANRAAQTYSAGAISRWSATLRLAHVGATTCDYPSTRPSANDNSNNASTMLVITTNVQSF